MQSYKVVGTAPVNGHAPGTTFEANPKDVAFFLAIGALEKAESIEDTIKHANIASYKRK